MHTLPPNDHNTTLAALCLAAMVALVVIFLSLTGCAHTADWPQPPFELRKVERGGKTIRAWVATCPRYRIRQTGDPDGFTLPDGTALVTQECCDGPVCHEVPVFLLRSADQ